jgi:DNA-binding NtrC family response regulator
MLAPKHLLIVDDEINTREGLRRLLRKTPFEISFASSAKEALEFLENWPVDIVLSDYHMEGMNGLELLEKISNLYPEVSLMMLSGKVDFKMGLEIIHRVKIRKFFQKPYPPEDLKIELLDMLSEFTYPFS